MGMKIELAERSDRLLASILDIALVFVPAVVVLFMLIVESRHLSGNLSEWMPILTVAFILAVVSLIFLFFYTIYKLSSQGQTIGKAWRNIKIVKKDTGENGGFFTNVLLRGLAGALCGAIPLGFFIDALFIFAEPKRCLHDYIAGTIVVCD
jgi:uncharacterized RDD family membrane protein YckC